ncbi:MAG TPA: hypothetical protein VGB55_11750, partial [Tepidisphaeraceae bacterium]
MTLPDQNNGSRTEVTAVIVLLGTIGLTTTLIGYLLLGDSLGLPLFLCFAAPLLPLYAATLVSRPMTAAAVSAGLALIVAGPMVFIGPLGGAASFVPMIVALAVTATMGLRLIHRIKGLPPIALFLTTLLLLAWLTWPIWMGPYWTNPRVARVLDPLVPYQPLLAANGAYAMLGEWAHQPIAYRYLTNLGQDVFYALPASAWPSALAHTLAALALLMIETALRLVAQPSTDDVQRGVGVSPAR